MSPSSARVAAVTLPSPAATGSRATDVVSVSGSKPSTPTSVHFPATPTSSTVVTVPVPRRSRRMVAALRRRSPMRWPSPNAIRSGTPVLPPVEGHGDDDAQVVDDVDGARVVVVTMDRNEMHHSTADLTPASPVREVAVAAEDEAVAEAPAAVDADTAPVAVAAFATNSSTSTAPTPTARYPALVPTVDPDLKAAGMDRDRTDATDHVQHDQSGHDAEIDHDAITQDPHDEAEPPRRGLLPTPTPSSPSASDLGTIPSPTASTIPDSSISTNSTYRVPSLRGKIAHLRHELAATRDVLADTNGALRAALADRATLVRENAALRAQIQVLAAALQESAGVEEEVCGSGGPERAGPASMVEAAVPVEHARDNHDDDELVGAGCDVTCSPRRAGARCAVRWPVAPSVAPAVREWATTTRSAVAPRAAAAARTTAAAARTLARSTSTASRTASAWMQQCITSHNDDPYMQTPHVPVPGPPIRAGAPLPRVGLRSAASIARLRAQAMAASSAGGGTPMSFRHALAATGPGMGTGTGSLRQRLRAPARSRFAAGDTAVATETDEDDGYIDVDAPISSPPTGPVPTTRATGAPARASWTPYTARAATPAPVVATDAMSAVSGGADASESGSGTASASPPRAPLCLVHGIVTDVPPLAAARRRASVGMGGVGVRQSGAVGTSWPPVAA
ncbi:hypothetical protein AMAG_17039 [Allomyces macrogynus ATCC 38327]|uniref:Uncharacterized protein n=1 Tax=Allomyces macrogynus (strain ATCC 38327) TaxID=578462 RepID=A0A0L0TD40_ALLM3|nr:hypothetical protein AMAG_17039 [Allomyces macrogynus ATCC 38327]|eukprot:KNE72596.1 hypothetical protein AMAG_17039 [Allomyces macrogynus ATCC 38327]